MRKCLDLDGCVIRFRYIHPFATSSLKSNFFHFIARLFMTVVLKDLASYVAGNSSVLPFLLAA
jgi:hypothetical protein